MYGSPQLSTFFFFNDTATTEIYTLSLHDALPIVLWIANRIALNEPWAPLAVSGVVFATSLPAFVLGPIAGVFVDRWDKRFTMLWTDALRAFLIFLLMLASGFITLPFVPPIQLSR